MKHDNVLIAYK